MKKNLFLLPLVAIALAGCGETACEHVDANKDHKCDKCSQVVSQHADGNKDHLCDTCSAKISEHAWAFSADSKHKCSVCGAEEACADANSDNKCDVCSHEMSSKPAVFEGLQIVGNSMWDSSLNGYSAYKGDHNVNGYTVNFSDVMINPDCGNSLSQDEEPANEYKTIQFKKTTGVMKVDGVKPSKAVIKVLLNDIYTWNSTQIGSVSFDGSVIPVPATSQKEACSYQWSYTPQGGTAQLEPTSVHTVTLDINATKDGEFKITNSGSFAFYILSIDLQK